MNVAKASDEKLRVKAEMISRHFDEVAKPLFEIENLDLMQVKDLMEKVYDVMDNIWTDGKIQPAYGEDRMAHFMLTCGSAFGARVEKELNKTDIWSSSFSDVRMKLNECIKLCKGWKDRITDLTG